MGLDATRSIQPSNNKSDISEFKKVSSLTENLPLETSKLVMSHTIGNLTPFSIQSNTVSDTPIDFQLFILLGKLSIFIQINNKGTTKAIWEANIISMTLPGPYLYSE